MNEPWVDVSSRACMGQDGPYRTVVATDRLGFRRVIGGAAVMHGLSVERGQAPTGKASLLLVEDSDDDAMLFELAVRKSGAAIAVCRAASVQQARLLLSVSTPSLIALDYQLGGESGLQLLQEIRARDSYRTVPVVMMSGADSDEVVHTAYAYGANSFLRKPTDCEEYLSVVNTMLEYWLDKNCTSLAGVNPPSSVWVG